MSQARGGPMLSGHASHQIGLDVDIWLRPMPMERYDQKQREKVSSLDVVDGRETLNQKNWSSSSKDLIRVAAEDSQVSRIFVNAVIKKQLCAETPVNDRKWLRKVRPWWGHDSHFHIRLSCPEESSNCENQAPPPAGDGCDNLTWWFTDEPYSGKSSGKKKDLLMDELPEQCSEIADWQ